MENSASQCSRMSICSTLKEHNRRDLGFDDQLDVLGNIAMYSDSLLCNSLILTQYLVRSCSIGTYLITTQNVVDNLL